MTYNISTLDPHEMAAEAVVFGSAPSYFGALDSVIDYFIEHSTEKPGATIEPIVSPTAVAALYRYHPLQAWRLSDDGQKSALLFIQEA